MRLALGLAALLCLTVLPMPSVAQEARGVAAIEDCVENRSRGGTQESVIGGCVGIVDGSCRGGTTLEISDCIMAEYRAWDSLLNRWWEPMKSAAQANGSWDGLLNAQRAWIAEKEVACQRAYDSAGGGSIRVIYGAECQRDMTAAKAVEFFYALYR
ncbi:hypothetical protein OCH239_02810 [Roseivivax halodurans JCM 10272]|uniref:Lysozyme inhibitor LprI-like N-terminal domain-containing protein n=1 Tax=Roseivivax halodurans JCM 10272 TaxID=1449350 RepID=X7EH26_9RHOB|nr:lysozyme inhibitor LprI family protein [Roseivivax halodurans]ETX14511.1 hypothetical protein OCH239_02810 [Roseivivax halodurans JCM 10272]